MKVFLQNDRFCRVITVRDADIDLDHYDDIWDVYTRAEFDGRQVDVCITGDKTTGACTGIDYDAPVRVEAYDMESDTNLFECRSPIVADEHKLPFGMAPDELIRRMAQVAMPIMAGSPFVRDFAYHDARRVRSTDAESPFLWLVRENGTAFCDLSNNEDARGMLCTMDQYRDQCCLFHYDGCDLRPVLPQTARAMLDKLTTPYAEYIEMETVVDDDEQSAPWCCETCGSTDVRQRVWADPNTKEAVDWENVENDDCWCEACERHTRQVRQSELVPKAAR
jgi:hypothetical protein